MPVTVHCKISQSVPGVVDHTMSFYTTSMTVNLYQIYPHTPKGGYKISYNMVSGKVYQKRVGSKSGTLHLMMM